MRKSNNKMEKNKTEWKRLNKKLLKSSFKSSVKNRKKINIYKESIVFFCIFIALFVANLIVEGFSINFWLADMVIKAIIVSGMVFIGSIISRRIQEK